MTTNTDELISLNAAVELFPSVDGQKPHVNTVYRWHRFGVRGHHLRAQRFGKKICTTEKDVRDFIAAQSAESATA